MKEGNVSISLNINEAWELAQLFKRITWDAVMGCAVDRAECESMLLVIEGFRGQLAEQGIAPR